MSSTEQVFFNDNQYNSNRDESVPKNTKSSSSSEEDDTRNNNYRENPAYTSSKVKEKSNSTSHTFVETKEEKSDTLKKEIQRKPNAEYNSFFLSNIWFCFYFRFVCRCSPIQDEDIYDINPDNKTDLATDRITRFWNKVFKEYDDKRKDYESEKLKNPEFDIYIYLFIWFVILIF